MIGKNFDEKREAEVADIHSSFDVETGERIEIFTLSKDLEKAYQV